MATGTVRLAVASGKGGTGKTTVATSLALSLTAPPSRETRSTPAALFLDCDVEAPNAHLFLGLSVEQRQEVAILLPRVDMARCTACGRCAEVCVYHAIVVLGERTLVLPELCHGCGSCARVCPVGAITESPHVIGVMEAGPTTAGLPLARGLLNVGEPTATPVVRQLKRWAVEDARRRTEVVILDVPPGTSCPVVEAVRGADFLILVTEPTPFGLHDLRLAAEVAAELAIPTGVVINRDGIGDGGVDVFCAGAGLPILMRIPFERAIAEGIAQGRTLVDIRPEYAPRFRAMYEAIMHQVRGT